MVARIIERVERAAIAPSQGHSVHEYLEEPLKEVHESPYRFIYPFSVAEFRVVTLVHFKEPPQKKKVNQSLEPTRRFLTYRAAPKKPGYCAVRQR